MAGGGVGEAMLIGAAVGATAGGAGAAIQGGDPLQGALVGGATGAIGGGIGGAMAPTAGAASGATGATAGTAAGSTTSLVPGAMAGTGAGTGAVLPGSVGIGATGSTNLGVGAMTAGGTGGSLGAAVPSSVSSGISGISGSALPAGGFSATGTMPTTLPGNFTGMAPQLSNTALGITAGTSALAGASQAERAQFGMPPEEEYTGPLSKFRYDPNKFKASEPVYAPGSVYRPTYAAEGGIMNAYKAGGVARYAPGGMIDPYMGIAAAQQSSQPSTGSQGIDALMGKKKRMLTKEQMDAVALQGMPKGAMQDVYGQMAAQGLAKGGQLGGYSDGGRMLKGPGDGMSDSIPGVIANKQPARLADGEFVVPADVVSHLGNGSTDAGAKQLYAMMNRVRKARTGNQKQGKQIKPAKYMVA